jgi:hypothetical protein
VSHPCRCVAQALRLDGSAAAGMVNSSLAGVAGMGGQLRQLAFIGLQHISDGSLMAALEQLPLLQVARLQPLQGFQRKEISQEAAPLCHSTARAAGGTDRHPGRACHSCEWDREDPGDV